MLCRQDIIKRHGQTVLVSIHCKICENLQLNMKIICSLIFVNDIYTVQFVVSNEIFGSQTKMLIVSSNVGYKNILT
jgi:hypothetical protein